MADNQFNNSNDEFEDIFSNRNKSDEYEDVFSSSGNSDEFEDISSGSEKFEDDFSKEVERAFQVKYNSAVENRRRQEIQYDNINDVYGELAKEEPRRKKKEKKRHPVRNTIITILCIALVGLSCVGVFGYQITGINRLTVRTEYRLEHVIDRQFPQSLQNICM